MKQKPRENIKIVMPMLSPEAAYELSNWLLGFAHEIDCYYGDEIRSHMQCLDNEREQAVQVNSNASDRLDDDIGF